MKDIFDEQFIDALNFILQIISRSYIFREVFIPVPSIEIELLV
jgi:hypothetical protein